MCPLSQDIVLRAKKVEKIQNVWWNAYLLYVFVTPTILHVLWHILWRPKEKENIVIIKPVYSYT